MFCGLFILYASLLLTIRAEIASVNRDDSAAVRTEWCARMCPPTPSPASAAPTQPHAQCPNVTCPTPVCPTPVCPAPPQPPACAACPEDAPARPRPRPLPWKALKNYTYSSLGYHKYYSDILLDWFDAQVFCESEGAHLLVLNSEEEDKLIRDQMKPGWIHVGIHHLLQDQGFTTVLGQPVNSTGFDKWLSGHSTWNITNNCGFINKSRRGLGMGLCSDLGRFVCEISFG